MWCKRPIKKSTNIRKTSSFWKLATMQGPFQNGHFGWKIKIVKTSSKTTLEPHLSCSVQKKKNDKRRENWHCLIFRKGWNKLVLGNLRLRKKHIVCIKSGKRAQYLWTWRQSVVPNDVPRDFGPVIAFGAKVQIPVARQGGREMSAPRPYVTDPFHPLSSIYK